MFDAEIASCRPSEYLDAVLSDEHLVLELCASRAGLHVRTLREGAMEGCRASQSELAGRTSVDIVHPSSHMKPLEFTPCTSAGSTVKQSPTCILPASLLSASQR
jgi:hypothetical protein